MMDPYSLIPSPPRVRARAAFAETSRYRGLPLLTFVDARRARDRLCRAPLGAARRSCSPKSAAIGVREGDRIDMIAADPDRRCRNCIGASPTRTRALAPAELTTRIGRRLRITHAARRTGAAASLRRRMLYEASTSRCCRRPSHPAPAHRGVAVSRGGPEGSDRRIPVGPGHAGEREPREERLLAHVRLRQRLGAAAAIRQRLLRSAAPHGAGGHDQWTGERSLPDGIITHHEVECEQRTRPVAPHRNRRGPHAAARP